MKIAYCIPCLYNPGGMERVLTEKVNYLVKHTNTEISIITTEQKDKLPYFELNDKIKLINLPVNFNNYSNQSIIKKYFSYRKCFSQYKTLLYDYLTENNIDICISLFAKEIEFLSKLKDSSIKLGEIHFAQDFRKQFLVANNKKNLFWRIIGYIRTKQLISSAKKLDKIIVLTKEDEKKWLKTNNNVVQIYNPCPIATNKITQFDNKRFISVGRLDAQKGYDYLIKAWSIVNKKYPEWKLDIFGQGEWKDMLNNEINNLNLSNSVSLKGVSKSIKEEYLNSSGYVMSSRYEGFGMVLVEAMTCGLPVISFDCVSGPSEIIKEGVNGYLVPVGDIKLLANRICIIIENESLRHAFGKKSKIISEDYKTDKIMKKWISLFNSLKK